MKKVLIHFQENHLRPTGGPAGYLFNLREGLNNCSRENINIDFMNESLNTIDDNQKLRTIIPGFIKDIRRAIKFSRYLKKHRLVENNIYNYDAVHFHSTEDMFLSRNTLKDYKGKVILTSHSPCVHFKEIINRINPLYYKLLKTKLDELEIMDGYAFKRADHIIFPCLEAEEPYYNTWEDYKNIREEKKYLYLPTGIYPCKRKTSRIDIRKRFNIPENAFLISYVGRHNEIKGYKDLKRIGQQLLCDPNIFFIIAGKEDPIKGLENDRWIEVGWTSDPHSIIAAADVFILPNRETYFDLILLEVLSLGKPVIISRTGGNKFFEKFNLKSIIEFSSNSEAVEGLKKLQSMSIDELDNLGEDNRMLFNQYFTVDKFATEYLRLLESVL